MKKNKGFTLVELLAVIAILAILIIIAIPNVTKLFKNSKENVFNSEVETIRKEIKREYVDRYAEGEIKSIISSVGDDPIDLTGTDMDYYAELDEEGYITYLEVTDGEFFYQYVNDEEKTIEIAEKEESNIISKIEGLKEIVITFDANGGNVSEPSKTVKYNSEYGNLPEPTRTGYTFEGWYTSKINGTNIVPNTKVTVTSNQMLYAIWRKDNYTAYDNNNEIIGNYETLLAAYNAITTPSGTIKVIDDVTDSTNLTIDDEKTIIIDTNEKTLTKNSYKITNNGTLKITGSGTITSKISNGQLINSSNKLYMDNGTLNGVGNVIVNVTSGTFYFTGGKIENLQSTSSTTTSVVLINNGANLSMNGGYIINTVPRSTNNAIGLYIASGAGLVNIANGYIFATDYGIYSQKGWSSSSYTLSLGMCTSGVMPTAEFIKSTGTLTDCTNQWSNENEENYALNSPWIVGGKYGLFLNNASGKTAIYSGYFGDKTTVFNEGYEVSTASDSSGVQVTPSAAGDLYIYNAIIYSNKGYAIRTSTSTTPTSANYNIKIRDHAYIYTTSEDKSGIMINSTTTKTNLYINTYEESIDFIKNSASEGSYVASQKGNSIYSNNNIYLGSTNSSNYRYPYSPHLFTESTVPLYLTNSSVVYNYSGSIYSNATSTSTSIGGSGSYNKYAYLHSYGTTYTSNKWILPEEWDVNFTTLIYPYY